MENDNQAEKSSSIHTSVWIVSSIVVVVVLGVVVYYFMHRHGAVQPLQTSQYQYTSNPTATKEPAVAISNTPQKQQNQVDLTVNGFVPSTLTVKTGDAVTWINQSGQDAVLDSDPHPVHTDYPPLNLGSFASSRSLSLTFPKPGRYGYHNHLNPSEKGIIIVQ